MPSGRRQSPSSACGPANGRETLDLRREHRERVPGAVFANLGLLAALLAAKMLPKIAAGWILAAA